MVKFKTRYFGFYQPEVSKLIFYVVGAWIIIDWRQPVRLCFHALALTFCVGENRVMRRS